jgi:hypothetical protein
MGGIQRFLPGGRSGFTTIPPSLIPEGPGGLLGLMGARGGVTGYGADGTVVGEVGDYYWHKHRRHRHTRPNKSGYYVQAVPGQPEQGGVWVAPESKLVPIRRRNLSNGRANTRALSRTVGLANQYKRLKKASRQLASACR